MIEKRTMWLIDLDFPHIKEYCTTVYMNTETNAVEFYEEDGDCFKPSDSTHFYNTQFEALAALNERRQEIRNMMPKVKDFIEMMEGVYSNNDFKYSKEDYLGSYAHLKRWSYEEDYNNLHSQYRRLLLVVHNGVMNVNAETFKVSEIDRIEWNKVNTTKDGKEEEYRAATIILKDGHKIRTRKPSEYAVIEDLFGDNMSNRIYSINENEDE